MSSFELTSAGYRRRCEQALQAGLATDSADLAPLYEAMRYVCLGGGKRIRAMLVYACGQLAGAEIAQLDAAAAAVEMVHAYSLTHDDLPAMDDDALRRDRAACHIQFDEATAVLVGDALQALAFELLAGDPGLTVNAARRLRMLHLFARASGGMVGGQQLDMQATAAQISLAQLQRMHRLKTGALMRAAAQLGALSSETATDRLVTQLDRYAGYLGLAFQIVDDVLDATSTAEVLGKAAGTDRQHDKSTYVSFFGLEKARRQADKVCRQAIESVQDLGDNAGFLIELVHFVRTRSH